VSLLDLEAGRELVDAHGAGLAAVVVESVVAGSTHPMLTDPKAFHPEDPGPGFEHAVARGDEEPALVRGDGFARITWASTAPGVPEIRTALTLYDDLDLVDVAVSLVKPERFGPESIFVTFPFAVGRPRFLLETAGAVYEAEREQLPDTSKDWYSVQQAVAVTDGECSVLWASADAPLVQLGGFHTGEWARSLEVRDGSINSWLMNNLHFTNFQARQDGTGTYRYRFAPRGAVAPADVRLFGRALREPLLARQYRGPVGPSGPALVVEPAEPVLAELRPLPDGRVRVRLRNLTADDVEVAVQVPGGPARSVRVPGYDAADAVLPG
jgi:alpha-mannosidase